jgi:MFS family permease
VGRAGADEVALWSAIGGGIASLGPLCSGFLLEHFYWGSVFLITLPLAVIAIVLAWWLVPAHVNESTEQVDNLGGVLSLVLVGALILSINFAPVPNAGTLTVVLGVIAVAALVAFAFRQRRARNPLYDLDVAARRTFWVAACAGIIVFGSLMGAMFVSQQYLQNVLGYSTLEAGAAFLPAVIFMVLVAPRSAKLVDSRGARFTLLCGYVFLLLAFATMLLVWKEGSSYWEIAIAYIFIGIGVGFAGTPASHSLTSSVPVRRAGMASGTADLQRDLGGAIMQSIFGALLTAGYATAAGTLVSSSGKNVTDSTQAELTKSFSSAADTASRYPASVQDEIIAGAKTAFLHGDQWAYTAGLVAVLLGAALVFFFFPRKQEEEQLLARYHAEDVAQPTRPAAPEPGAIGIATNQP